MVAAHALEGYKQGTVAFLATVTHYRSICYSSASRTRTCNPAVTAAPQLSLRSGLSHHPSIRRPATRDSSIGRRALLGLIGEILIP